MIAQTLKEKYEDYGCEVKVFDIFNEYNRFFNILMEKIYLLSYKKFFDKVYGYLYYSFERSESSNFDNLFYGLFKDIVLNVIDGFTPDLIVNTYNHRTVLINKNNYFPNIPIVNVVTEFTLPTFWLHNNVDKYYLACSETKEILDRHLDNKDSVISGIPVRKGFLEELDSEKLKRKYNIPEDKTVLILFAGTFGVLKNLIKICEGLENINDLYTIVICGLNKKLYNKLSKKDFKNIQLMRYISDIQEIYSIGDIMVTKPGGTVLSEIVQTGIPVILYDPVPGQELENALIFETNNAGIIANTVEEVLSEVLSLKDQKLKRDKLTKNLTLMNNGDSSKIIVEDSLKLIK